VEVAAWLQDLGLERYVPAFRDNDVDAEVLPKLTAEDLISIANGGRSRRRGSATRCRARTAAPAGLDRDDPHSVQLPLT
jgi:hypothetical protein